MHAVCMCAWCMLRSSGSSSLKACASKFKYNLTCRTVGALLTGAGRCCVAGRELGLVRYNAFTWQQQLVQTQGSIVQQHRQQGSREYVASWQGMVIHVRLAESCWTACVAWRAATPCIQPHRKKAGAADSKHQYHLQHPMLYIACR
jgi:hypothetical protein